MSSKDHPVAVELVTDDLRGLAARQGKTAYGGICSGWSMRRMFGKWDDTFIWPVFSASKIRLVPMTPPDKHV
jgi:hypothetical protein